MRRTILMGVLVFCCTGTFAFAQMKASAKVVPMTFKVETSALGEGARGATAAGGGYYPVRDPATKRPAFAIKEQTVDVIVLDNGIVEAWVCPAWGGRLLRAVDKQTGVDYFWRRMRDGDWVADDYLPWNPGGVKPSFPFFEHGTGLQSPAGYRIVEREDGSITVAMDLRFTQYKTAADIDRYGRYGDEALGIMVTIRPGSSVVEWTQRKDNNNATPRSNRMWNDTSYPLPVIKTKQMVKQKDGTEVEKEVADLEATDKLVEFIFPARWVVDHGPTQVHTSPHWSAPRNWNVSHFAVDAPYGFAGGYYPTEREGGVNRIRINDTRPGHGPGAKIWTAPGPDMFEIWGGESWVFEYPGELLPAYAASAFTHKFWTPMGIGRVSYANADVAVGVDGDSFKLVASRHARATVFDERGQLSQRDVGPHRMLEGKFSGKQLIVKLNDVEVMNQTFPLDRPVPAKETPIDPAAQARFDKLKEGVNPSHPTFFERSCYGRNQGQPGIINATGAFKSAAGAGERTASLARVAYRLGDLDEAKRLAELAGGAGADYVLGLIAMERGEATDFGKAGVEADYLRALQAKKAGDQNKAIELAKKYTASVPDAWYPRLAIAYWTQDASLAKSLADENPASLEAQWVLSKLSLPAQLEQTLGGRDETRIHVEIFADQLEKGIYRPVPRFPLELLKPKK